MLTVRKERQTPNFKPGKTVAGADFTARKRAILAKAAQDRELRVDVPLRK